jgi:SAM-dependent methyltransferase
LPRSRLLDPRSAAEAAAQPIHDAVNIPLAELPRRTHELPPRQEVVRVVGPAEVVAAAVAWLEQHGRLAVAEAPFSYESAATARGWGRLWEPTEFLAEMLPQLPAGRALDLACGVGRDSVFLAAAGWEVTGVDVLPDALERGQGLAERYVPDAEIRWVLGDLEAGSADLGGPYDLILMFRYLHRPLLAELPTWLASGGSVLVETFTTLHRERHGRPSGAGRALEAGELRGLISGVEIRRYSEEWRGDVHTARLWAVRPVGSGWG